MKTQLNLLLSIELVYKLREASEKTGLSMNMVAETGLRSLVGLPPPVPSRPGRPRSKPAEHRVSVPASLWETVEKCAQLEGVTVEYVLDEGWPGCRREKRSIVGSFPGLADATAVIAQLRRFTKSTMDKHGIG